MRFRKERILVFFTSKSSKSPEVIYSTPYTPIAVPEPTLILEKPVTYEQLYNDAITEALLKFKLTVKDNIDNWVLDQTNSGNYPTIRRDTYTFSKHGEEIFSIHAISSKIIICCKSHTLASISVDDEDEPSNRQYQELYDLYKKIAKCIDLKKKESAFMNQLEDLNSVLGRI
jgi:hypothetical protein